jgi:hypothetical protein
VAVLGDVKATPLFNLLTCGSHERCGFMSNVTILYQLQYKIMVRNNEGKRPFDRPRRTWVGNIKITLLKPSSNDMYHLL